MRSVPEWIGKTDNTAIPPRVKARILQRQDNKCAVTDMVFNAALKPEFDHIIAIANGGENRESNIQALCEFAHKHKTKKDVAQKSRDARVRAKHLGLHKPKSKLAGSKESKWKRKVDGTVVPRD